MGEKELSGKLCSGELSASWDGWYGRPTVAKIICQKTRFEFYVKIFQLSEADNVP